MLSNELKSELRESASPAALAESARREAGLDRIDRAVEELLLRAREFAADVIDSLRREELGIEPCDDFHEVADLTLLPSEVKARDDLVERLEEGSYREALEILHGPDEALGARLACDEVAVRAIVSAYWSEVMKPGLLNGPR